MNEPGGVVRRLENGILATGEREVEPHEAGAVQSIFRAYAAGVSPKRVATQLNARGVPGPGGAAWNPSTIHGNYARGTGILNNELYIGRLFWNRIRYLKDPDSGRRVSRLNPPSEWVIQEVPELRIVDQGLWGETKARQRQMRQVSAIGHPAKVNHARRPRFLFSDLARCGACGGGYVVYWRERLACFAARVGRARIASRSTVGNWKDASSQP